MAEGPRQVQVEERLKAAAERGDIEGLYGSIKEDPTVLDRMDAIPFVETPLHVAVSAGHELFVKEILRLKPPFGRKLNPDGLSPLHLALINRKFDMVQLLIDLDKELIRVEGKEGETPLHFIVKKEDIDYADADQQQRVEGRGKGGEQQREDPRILKMAEFLFACPNSIEDRTIRDETALHIAVKTKNKCAAEVILGFIIRINKKEVLAATDYQGNTALHMAVKNSHHKMVELLVKKFNRDDINKKNSVERKTALDIALSLGTDEVGSIVRSLRNAGAKTSSSPADDYYSLAKFLSSPEDRIELFHEILLFCKKRLILSMEQRNLVLVVAVLIATATFQAILTPPGGQGGGNDRLLTNGSYVSANVSSSSSNHLFAANTSFINATLFIPTDVHGDNLSEFYLSTQMAFFFSMVIIMSVLPFTLFASLYAALFFLINSYQCSIDLASRPSTFSATYFLWLVYPFRIFCSIVIRNTSVDNFIEPFARQRVRMLRRLIRNYDGE